MWASWRRVYHRNLTSRATAAPLLSRRAAVVSGAVTMAAALSGCASDSESEPELAPIFTPPSEAAAPRSDSLGDATNFTVADRHLNTGLLQRFYARRGSEPVWASRQSEANSLLEAVRGAADHGLDPELFHATLLQKGADLSSRDRELLLSDAFLSYADALARGAVPVERRKDDEILAPEPVDVAAVLDSALDSSDPGASIDALAPTTRTYGALRDALRAERSHAFTGGAAATARRRTIEVNLERQRWLPRALSPERVWVNVADQKLVMYQSDRPVFSARVVVGEDVEKNQSPEFHTAIDASFYNPPWVVPADIASAEILPKLTRDPDYLTRNKMILLANGEVEQLPGPEAGLGLIMFDMPNRFDVYLHDTPDRYIFSRANRRISHGCIRVENPRELAALLINQPKDTVDEGIAAGNTTRVDLPTPVPVFVVYQTAFVDTADALQFRPDFYRRDAKLWQQLQTPPQQAPGFKEADDRRRLRAAG